MNLTEIISLCSVSLGVISAFIGFIISLVKAIKTKNIEKVKNVLNSAAKEAVIFAENVKGISGEAKKQIALTKINQQLIGSKLKYDESEAANVIESFISLSKEVNAKNNKNNENALKQDSLAMRESHNENSRLESAWRESLKFN